MPSKFLRLLYCIKGLMRMHLQVVLSVGHEEALGDRTKLAAVSLVRNCYVRNLAICERSVFGQEPRQNPSWRRAACPKTLQSRMGARKRHVHGNRRVRKRYVRATRRDRKRYNRGDASGHECCAHAPRQTRRPQPPPTPPLWVPCRGGARLRAATLSRPACQTSVTGACPLG